MTKRDPFADYIETLDFDDAPYFIGYATYFYPGMIRTFKMYSDGSLGQLDDDELDDYFDGDTGDGMV